MAKPATNQPTPLRDWDEVNAALKRIGDLESDICARRDAAETAERELLQKRLDALAPLNAELAGLQAGLKAFAEARREEFGANKSRALEHGTVGFYAEPRFTWPTIKTLVARLRQHQGGKAYLVPQEPKVDKRGIMANWKKLPLQELGVKRRVLEVFRYQRAGSPAMTEVK